MSFFVRQSKFRHVFVKPMKREFCLEDIRITKITWDSLFCAVNPKFIAIITEGSGGPFMVIPLNKAGRVEKEYPVVDAHKAPCLEIAWSPFNDNIIASCSEDCTTKVWHIPDRGLIRSLKEPVVELVGHQKRVTSILWHPVANNILLSAGADLKILIWNVGTGEALIEIAGHPDLIWSVDFNYNGSKIVTTCKDKKIRVVDVRTGRIMQQGMGHEGMKPQRAIFLRDGRIFSTGFTKRSERMYALRDEEALEEPIVQQELDTSNGVLYPLFDADTGLLYLCGKGDSNIRYYEVNTDPPFVHFINVYSTPEPQRGIGFMPKRGLNVNENEIARVYKCTNKGLVDVLQFFVPRKSELFQDDLYPDTASIVPALTADEWFEGKDADPVLMPLKGDRPSEGSSVIATKSAVSMTAQQESQSGSTKPLTKKANMLAQMPAPEQQREERPTERLSRTPTSPRETTKPKQEVFNSVPPPSREEHTPVYRTQSRGSRDSLDHVGSGSQASSASSRRSTLYDQSEPTTPIVRNSRSVPDWGGTDGIVSPSSFYNSRPGPQAVSTTVVTSVPTSVGPMTGSLRTNSGQEVSIDELVSDLAKLKSIVKRHERRIRFLEEQLQEQNSIEFD